MERTVVRGRRAAGGGRAKVVADRLVRIPLAIVAPGGEITPNVIVAVLASDLDRLEAGEEERFLVERAHVALLRDALTDLFAFIKRYDPDPMEHVDQYLPWDAMRSGLLRAFLTPGEGEERRK